ncbi:dUTP diphosphatase [Candidatus Pacearchaeota archaeon]|nr:dUTP diphosphatase [Candidatus Pacearchaeota archaeon]
MNNQEIYDQLPTNLLEAIFEKQAESLAKYISIESASELLYTRKVPVNLQCRFGQAQLKDYAWRFTEELGEAAEAFNKSSIEDFHEELIDALHFLVGICILSDIWPKDLGGDLIDVPILPNTARETESLIFRPIARLSLTMNCLKNKPWKQKHIDTDILKYREYLINTFHLFINTLFIQGLHPRDIYFAYCKKNKTNEKRREEKY